MELEKHRVFVASNVDEALEITKNTEFAIVLLDLMLNGSDGLDFLVKFDVKKHPDTKIIVISNLFTYDLLNKALKLGAKHYLIKSDITPTKLAEVVRETLDESPNTQRHDKD